MISNKFEKTTNDEVSLLRYAPDNSMYYVKNNLHKSSDNVDHLSKASTKFISFYYKLFETVCLYLINAGITLIISYTNKLNPSDN